jgi:hypothetical protein
LLGSDIHHLHERLIVRICLLRTLLGIRQQSLHGDGVRI